MLKVPLAYVCDCCNGPILGLSLDEGGLPGLSFSVEGVCNLVLKGTGKKGQERIESIQKRRRVNCCCVFPVMR